LIGVRSVASSRLRSNRVEASALHKDMKQTAAKRPFARVN